MRSITHIAAIGVIYRESDPRQILMEIKDDGHRRPSARRGLSFIGGNWSGDEAKNDQNPHETFCRNVERELAFTHQRETPVKLEELGQIPTGELILKPNGNRMFVTEEDALDLEELKRGICEDALECDSFLNTEPDGRHALVFVYECPLNEDRWRQLVRLMTDFGSISGEGLLVLTSLDELIRTQHPSAFGINGVLERFWHEHDLNGSEIMLSGSTIAEWCGPMGLDYSELIKHYDIAPTSISP